MPDGSSNICWPKPPEWRWIAQGKHSRVYDCGNGWVFKQSVSSEQTDALYALNVLEWFADVPAMCLGIGGYYQRKVEGREATTKESMKLAYRINRQARELGLYFHDLVPANILFSREKFWVVDALCRHRTR